MFRNIVCALMLYSKDHVREINYSEKQIERKMFEYTRSVFTSASLSPSIVLVLSMGIVCMSMHTYRRAVLVYTFIDLCETLFHSLGGTKLATNDCEWFRTKNYIFLALSRSLHFPSRHRSDTAPVKWCLLKQKER